MGTDEICCSGDVYPTSTWIVGKGSQRCCHIRRLSTTAWRMKASKMRIMSTQRRYVCTNMGDNHDLYLRTCILLLADVFENFCLEHYSLDLTQYYSSPRSCGMLWLKRCGAGVTHKCNKINLKKESYHIIKEIPQRHEPVLRCDIYGLQMFF